MGDPIGHIWIKREFTATTRWPGEQFTLDGVIDMEQEYKEALAGQLVPVMEKGVDGSYLVYGEGKKTGGFIWVIEAEDTKGFIPIIKKNGMIIPAGMNPLEEMIYMAESMQRDMKIRYKHEKENIRKKYRQSADYPRKTKKRVRKELNFNWRINETLNSLLF